MATEPVDLSEASTQPMIVLPGSFGFSARDAWAGLCKLQGISPTKREIKVLPVHACAHRDMQCKLPLTSSVLQEAVGKPGQADMALAFALCYERSHGRASAVYPYVSLLSEHTPDLVFKSDSYIAAKFRDWGAQCQSACVSLAQLTGATKGCMHACTRRLARGQRLDKLCMGLGKELPGQIQGVHQGGQ